MVVEALDGPVDVGRLCLEPFDVFGKSSLIPEELVGVTP